MIYFEYSYPLIYYLCFQIADIETGQPLGVDEPGEVWLSGPQISNGYLNQPAQTRHMFTKDGWVKTGDVILCANIYLFYNQLH